MNNGRRDARARRFGSRRAWGGPETPPPCVTWFTGPQPDVAPSVGGAVLVGVGVAVAGGELGDGAEGVAAG